MNTELKKTRVILLTILTLATTFTSTYLLIEKIFFKEYNRITFSISQMFNSSNCSFIEVFNSEKEYVIDKLDFENGTHKCLSEKIKNKKNLTILNSFGGSTLEAIQIVNFIKNNNIEVKIKEKCYSACTYLLFFSNYREVCKSSKIGTHQSSISIESLRFLDITKPEINKNLKEKNINLEYYYDIIAKTPNKKIYIYTKEELLKNNMVDNIINC